MSTPGRWIFLFGPALLSMGVCGADFASYRGLHFGADLTAIAKQVGRKPKDVKIIHHRPAVIQELEWRTRSAPLAGPPDLDTVTGGDLSFLDGKLFRIVVAYDRYRIEGMTVNDMVEAISLTYGTARFPDTEIRLHSYFAGVAKVLARCEDTAYAYDLVRTDDQNSFALVLYSKASDELAQAAILRAAQLDALDAPRLAEEAEKRRSEAGRLALEKSRAANKPNFRP